MGKIEKLYDWRIIINGLTTYVSWRNFDIGLQNYLVNSEGLKVVKRLLSEGKGTEYEENALSLLNNSVDKWLGLSTVSLILMLAAGSLTGYCVYKAIKHKTKYSNSQDVQKFLAKNAT